MIFQLRFIFLQKPACDSRRATLLRRRHSRQYRAACPDVEVIKEEEEPKSPNIMVLKVYEL